MNVPFFLPWNRQIEIWKMMRSNSIQRKNPLRKLPSLLAKCQAPGAESNEHTDGISDKTHWETRSPSSGLPSTIPLDLDV
jgi:hypothetical protein